MTEMNATMMENATATMTETSNEVQTTQYEMTEQLAGKMHITLAEARAALEAADWNMLTATHMLEQEEFLRKQALYAAAESCAASDAATQDDTPAGKVTHCDNGSQHGQKGRGEAQKESPVVQQPLRSSSPHGGLWKPEPLHRLQGQRRYSGDARHRARAAPALQLRNLCAADGSGAVRGMQVYGYQCRGGIARPPYPLPIFAG